MKERVLILTFMLLYIFIRSVNFSTHLNFSAEQASFSIRALEIWNNKEITLVGPAISFKADGREVFQSSITYYAMIPFLLLGNLDPVASSYLLVLFGSLMIYFLYFGTKKLLNRNAAFLLIGLYTFYPFYIDYSRFFWNPNFQFLLSPLLVYYLGLFKETKRAKFCLISGLISGALLLFHYQFIIIILGIIVYLSYLKLNRTTYVLGAILGFSPMIAFELKNNLYNLQTALYIVKSASGSLAFAPHYVLSISLFAVILFSSLIKRANFKYVALLISLIAVYSFVKYSKPSLNGFGMASNWNLSAEKQVYEIIQDEDLKDYNVVNLIYDTTANVQRYLHFKDRVTLPDDYKNNQYLFVISTEQGIYDTKSYEVTSFFPSQEVKTWSLHEGYKLHLLKRL